MEANKIDYEQKYKRILKDVKESLEIIWVYLFFSLLVFGIIFIVEMLGKFYGS